MKRLRGENGVEMLEFALVIPIFVFVLYGLIAFGVMLNAKQTMTHAVSEGARAAIGATQQPGDANLQAAQARVAKQQVKQSVEGALGGNYDDSMTTATVDTCSTGSGKCITVKLTYPYESKPLVPNAPGLGLMLPSSLSSTAVVQVP